jgi:hypothetical protein
MGLEQFLKFMLTPSGLTIVVGVVLGLASKYIKRYADLPTDAKVLVLGVITLILPLAAATIGTLALGWVPTEPGGVFWQAISVGTMMFLGAVLPEAPGSVRSYKSYRVAKSAAAKGKGT